MMEAGWGVSEDGSMTAEWLLNQGGVMFRKAVCLPRRVPPAYPVVQNKQLLTPTTVL